MMFRPMRPALLAVALAMATTAAWSETLDFRQCVSQALAQNPDMAVAQAQIGQAEAAVRQAKANHLPRLNLSLTGTYTNDALNAFGLKLSQRNAAFSDFGPIIPATAPYPSSLDNLNHPDATTNFNPRVELLVPVYNGGMVTQYVKQAQSYVRAAQAGDRLARQQLVKHVLMAYQGVHTARAYIQVAREGVAAAEEYVRITDRLLKQGMALKSDLLSAQVNLEDVKLKLSEARNAEATALDQLHLLLGKSLAEPLDVGAPVMPVLLDGETEALRTRALANHSGLQALREQGEGAGAAVEAARAGKRPQFNIMLRQDWNADTPGFDAASYTAAGVLTWTAFDGGSSQAGVDRAESARIELAAKLRQAADGVAYQVGEAKRRAIEAEEKAAARSLALEQASEAQRLVQKRYENGLGTLIELLAAQAQLDKARADLVAAHYEQAVQRAELKLAVGVLDANEL
ncbi:MAG: TolC family protein [Gallionellaceae bacterium]|nr:TolC family protein [Gallionellaceae bacterium]